MAVPAAFSDLLAISSQVEAAIVLDGDETVATSFAEQSRSDQLAVAVRELAQTAEKTRPGLKQIEVSIPQGHVFVVSEGSRLIGATTAPDPPSGLVFYDLRSCLSALSAETPAGAKGDAAK